MYKDEEIDHIFQQPESKKEQTIKKMVENPKQREAFIKRTVWLSRIDLPTPHEYEDEHNDSQYQAYARRTIQRQLEAGNNYAPQKLPSTIQRA